MSDEEGVNPASSLRPLHHQRNIDRYLIPDAVCGSVGCFESSDDLVDCHSASLFCCHRRQLHHPAQLFLRLVRCLLCHLTGRGLASELLQQPAPDGLLCHCPAHVLGAILSHAPLLPLRCQSCRLHRGLLGLLVGALSAGSTESGASAQRCGKVREPCWLPLPLHHADQHPLRAPQRHSDGLSLHHPQEHHDHQPRRLRRGACHDYPRLLTCHSRRRSAEGMAA
mmetsp:Transcript_38818/g.122325  ORF Transcript_38818/g.122325 Transcript_38818/m.122325 type:complete len:224 (+) Transcript_38818:213-884(+)